MLAEQPHIISLTQLAAVAGCSRDHIAQIYPALDGQPLRAGL